MVATYGQRQRVLNIKINIFYLKIILFVFQSRLRFLMGINGLLLAFAIFIIVSMSIYWGFFEEWTIWTDYTMAWVGFISHKIIYVYYI
jgi:hypothetical protein